MNLENLKKSWSNFVNNMNEKGIPLPTLRDPKTGFGSVSLTLVFISFNIVAFGLIGKAAGVLGGVDLAQALNLFYATAALYWGRKFQGKEVTLDQLGQPNQPAPKSTPPAAPQKVDSPD